MDKSQEPAAPSGKGEANRHARTHQRNGDGSTGRQESGALRRRRSKRGTHNSRNAGGNRNPRNPRGPRPFTPAQLEARRAAVPHITYPETLPVSARRAEIRAAIAANQVVIIAGETGSGKTTQLPKICLELGRGITGLIGHTQPRRIAARSVAERIAAELGQKVGGAVGYQVRFTEEVGPTTLVKLMTDGILLAEIQSDPQLLRYDTLIIDEAHERSLNIDFILGYLARLLPARPDLKVIITSATIDTERFAAHFGEHRAGGRPGDTAPIIEVSGRTYPVEIRYRPLDEEQDTEHEEQYDDAGAQRVTAPRTPGRAAALDQVSGIVAAAEELMAEGEGDILVFLSGEGEIRDTAKALDDELGARYVAPGGRSSAPGAVEVLPLFSRLSAAEQHRIFQHGPYRRIILATNIAETSLTVPGIRYVIDPGTARISRYSNKTKVQRLPIEPISQASANQRSGRCGRVMDGVAIRLYSEDDFLARPEFTQPEIQRTSLAAVILQMLALGLGAVDDFPFIDPPEARAVRAGTQLLEEIGAISYEGGFGAASAFGADNRHAPRLTAIGRQLARLPIDPRLGRMLIEAQRNGCASEVLVLVAALSVQDVRERPTEKRAQADQFHARFTAGSSDFLAYLTLWRYLRTQARELSGSAFRRMCRAEFLNYLRYREWADVVAQLEQMARPLELTIRRLALPSPKQIRAAAEAGAPQLGGAPNSGAVAHACRELGRGSDTPESGAIHRSLLVGLLSNIGNYSPRSRDYLGARGTHFVIWPGSGLHRRTPEWVMAAELVETSRLFARTVAAIQPEWIEPLAKKLVRRSYSEPYWSAKNGAAMVHEKVTLYGVTLVADRPVLLATSGSDAARELAREMFIRHGLVEGEWRTHHEFLARNRAALEEAGRTEDKLRRHGLVADNDALTAFYEERIPESVVSGRHFDSWWKKERQARPELLDFTQDFLLGGAGGAGEEDFPTEWHQGDITLPITYTFAPGSFNDGITVDVPIALLPRLRPEGFDWLVPGMLDELVVATIRALPKRVRRNLVPAPDVARDIRAVLPGWEQAVHGTEPISFEDAFRAATARVRGIEIDDAAWQEVHLPAHLTVNFRVRSERGAVLEESTSLEYVQRSLAPQTKEAVENVVAGAVAQALDEARARLRKPSSAKQGTEHSAGAQSAGAPSAGTPAARSASTTSSEGAAAAELASGDALTGWPEVEQGIIPAVIETEGPAGTVRAYPALADRAGKVVLDVVAEPGEQVRVHRGGVIRLLADALALPEGRITSRWDGELALQLAGSPAPSTAALVADVQWAAARNLADRWGAANDASPEELRSGREFEELQAWARDEFEDEVFLIAQGAGKAAAAWAEVEQLVRDNRSVALLATMSDERAHLDALMPADFVRATPVARFWDLPRYLQAAKLRIEKAAVNPAADDSLAWQVQTAADAVESAREEASYAAFDPGRARVLDHARWLLEELRVSLFAQQLGTKEKVSVKRIQKLLAS
ncbi:ATP-dependent RNA helicase HrpA [Actinotignum schaalii]|uniref:ATP-dependent RNA helicase HrpA n=1 Tax=Actinotignum schaalii TaxID=59505 RepID=UPI00237E7B73|nr:ATP-dependent RNA helicase HrpA [Actinotignum schaalii]MDE1655069.1 ATP-dependent RNA helicase HrpA [Actinotignum schaalii]